MGILDEAIKEHLELKRQSGAGESELKKIEDEAFGAAERPGSEPAGEEGVSEEAPVRQRSEIADLQEPPAESPPAEEEPPAMEHETVVEPSTDERQAIAEQPTEMYDVEEELGDAEPADAEPEVHALSQEDEEFWDEKRLSDELNQALEAPIELDEEAAVERLEPESQPEPEAEDEPESEPQPEDEPAPDAGHEDVLEDTPDFLEEAPEDDRLWFEQKPPKDFDFDD